MMSGVKEIMFYVFKDGKALDRQVGFLYNTGDMNYKNNKQEKLDRLMAEYPESEGYKLCVNYERTL